MLRKNKKRKYKKRVQTSRAVKGSFGERVAFVFEKIGKVFQKQNKKRQRKTAGVFWDMKFSFFERNTHQSKHSLKDRGFLTVFGSALFVEQDKKFDFGEYLDNYKYRKDILGKGYHISKAIDRNLESAEELLFGLLKKIFCFSWRKAFVFSMRCISVFVILTIVYSSTPGTLGAPKSIAVTTKGEWEAGNLEQVYTTSERGSIQLEPAGTWRARSWATPPKSITTGSSSVLIDEYMYVPRGGNSSEFYRYDVSNDDWEKLPDMPQLVAYGGDSVYGKDGNIYYIFGAYTKYFYKYEIENGIWTRMPDLPDSVYYGAAIEYDGTDFYVTRGSYSTDFWRFDVSEGIWYSASPTPTTIYYGSDTIYHDGYLYTLRGSSYTPFWRYNISSDEWETLADAPASTEERFWEQKGVYHDGFIYYFRSYNNSADFLRYSISDNSWEKIDSAPNNTGYGSSIQYNEADGLFYALAGRGTFYLWKFDPEADSNGEWVGPADAPGTFGTGADLIWNGIEGEGGYLYATRGNGSASFYRYDIANNRWDNLEDLPNVLSRDVKGTYHNGFVYIPRGYDEYDFYRYNVETGVWDTTANPPAVLDQGSVAVYNPFDGYIYVTRGNSTSTFYRYDIESDSWTTLANISADGAVYNSYDGTRMVSDGRDLYLTSSFGDTAFLKYDTVLGTWSLLEKTPFPVYLGADMDFYDGKIYALAGYYRNETWEYDIVKNSWRQLPRNQEWVFERGPYNGASLVYSGSNSFFATMGFSLSHMMSFTASPNNYELLGTYTSQAIDLSYSASWVSFDVNSNVPENTSATYETRTSSDALGWSAWQEVVGTDIESPPNRYVQVRITLESVDGINTPTVEDFSISFNSEDNDPSNPSNITGFSTQVNGESLVSGQSYSHAHPYFDWSEGEDLESGVNGYYVYFGTDNEADPEMEGIFQTNSHFTVNLAMNNSAYYLRIKTKDNDGNITDAAWDAFTYLYNGVHPYLTNEKTSKEDFDLGEVEGVSSSVETGALMLELVDGFWNESRLSYAPETIYTGAKLAHVESTGKLYTLRGNSAATFYEYDIATDTWSSLADAPSTVSQGGFLVEGPEGYLFASRGGVTPTFWRYDIANDLWQQMANAPKSFNRGASLAYPGGDSIFAFMGSDDAMYKYSISQNRWSNLSYAQFGNPNVADGQLVYNGGGMEYDGVNNVYVLQGGGYPYFAKFTINDNQERGEDGNTWTTLESSPRAISSGGSIAFDFDRKFYVLAGGNSNDFMSYDVESSSWSMLPEIPGAAYYGASLEVVDGYVYATRGNNSTIFYRFNIDKNSWEIPQGGFWGPTTQSNTSYHPFYYGTTMASDNDSLIYIAKGYGDTLFGSYNITTGEFSRLADTPAGVYNGASMVYNEDEKIMYLTSGNLPLTRSDSTADYFMKYDVVNDRWEFITADPITGGAFQGSSMAYDGDRYIYMTRGSNSSTWKRYDTKAAEGSRWSSNLPTTTGWYQGYGGMIAYVDGYIYSTRGNNGQGFWRYNVSAGNWEVLQDIPSPVYVGASIAYGNDGYIYATAGGNLSNFYRFKISNGTWEEIQKVPAQIRYGGWGLVLKNRFWAIAGQGTNTVNHGLYSYVIGSEENQTGFEKYGTYTSDALDLTAVYRWANLVINVDLPNNTHFAVSTRSSANGTDWSAWDSIANQQLTAGGQYLHEIVSAPSRYLQYKIDFTSSDRIFSPKLYDVSVNYYQDIDVPENPTAVTAYDSNLMQSELVTDTWYNHSAPHFVWPEAETEGGASDGEGGSGVIGYYVCFGAVEDCSDPYSEGSFQEGNSYTASGLVSGREYNLLIKAVDDAQMIPAESFDAFIYSFDSTPPTNPSDISVNPTGYTASDSYSFLWQNDAADANSGLGKFQYRMGGDEEGIWLDINDVGQVSLSLPNEDHPLGAYQSGRNWFYLRTVDNAGNVSSSLSQEYYFSMDAPSPPRNLEVSPEYSETNGFSFSWEQPESFLGSASELTYHYSVNALPNAFNTVETRLTFAGPGPFASQKGPNRFYICAMDEAKNIDYSLYAYVDFTADTSAPGPPVNIQIFDTSDRENQEYSIALKWSPPAAMNEDNFDGYVIYRSDDNVSFEEVATTSGSAYVDTELESRLYYYYAKSKDSTNNISVASSTVSIVPTGRYTTPPTLVTDPSSTTQSFAAAVSWATNRVASSFVEYGTSMSLGKTNGQVDSVTAHTVELNGLDAGTTYYYRAKFIDPDGNIGTSDIGTFETLPPPTISEVTVSDIGLFSATVSWKTNTDATCTLKYGAGSYAGTIEEASSGTGHVARIEGLESSTVYKIQIDAIDSDLNEFNSDEYNFTTLEQPVTSDFVVENKENVDLPTLVVKYNTSIATTTLVKFKTGAEGSFHNYLTNEYVTEHVAEITGLEPSVEYEIVATGVDVNGIEATIQEAKITTRADSRPPGILVNRAVGKVVGRGKASHANMYIKIETDEVTTAQVFYSGGIVLNNFEQNSNLDPLNTYHLITIPVDPGQVYSYIVKTYDDSQNETITKPVTVVVEGSKDSASEIVLNTFSNKFDWITRLWKK